MARPATRIGRQGIIIVPARFDSVRLPGKPLKQVSGKEMLLRVVETSRWVAGRRADIIDVVVATEHELVAAFCAARSIPCVIIEEDCSCGSERVALAMAKLQADCDFAINLQCDNPLCPPAAIEALADAMQADPAPAVATPYHQLTWEDLDFLRAIKRSSPHSGTSVVVGADGEAVWFSKAVLPSIRNEPVRRVQDQYSPVNKHLGAYAYRRDVLKLIPQLRVPEMMEYEGLEQFMFLEAGIAIRMLRLNGLDRRAAMPGLNTLDLIATAEQLIAAYGEII